MRQIMALMSAIAVSLPILAPAEGGLILLSGGTAGVIPIGTAIDDYIPALFPGPTIGGYFGTQIGFNVQEPSVLLIEFFGAEAGFPNRFNLAGTDLFDHPGGTSVLATGLSPFSFDVNVGAAPKSVANGSNPDNSTGTLMVR